MKQLNSKDQSTNEKYFLNNGKEVTLKAMDGWHRLIVKIEGIEDRNFCIVDALLHSISGSNGYAEPCCPLKNEYQLEPESLNKLKTKFNRTTCSF